MNPKTNIENRLKAIFKAIDFLLHPQILSTDPVQKLKSRVVVILLLFNITIVLTGALFVSPLVEVKFFQVLNALTSIFFLLYFKRTGNFNTVALGTATSIFTAICCITYLKSGLYSSDVFWYCVLIINMVLFLDRRKAIYFIAAGYVFIVGMYFVEKHGWVDFRANILLYTPEKQLINIIVIYTTTAVISYQLFDLEKVRYLLEMRNKDKMLEMEQMIAKKTSEMSLLRSSLGKDFHDEMGNKLTGISMLTRIAIHKIEKNEIAELPELISKIHIISNELFDGTKDFIWSVDYRSDYVSYFFDYMAHFGDTFLKPLQISFIAEHQYSEQEFELIKFTENAATQLLWICKEIINNAAKHSRGDEITFTMYKKSDTESVIVIADNGSGFDPKQVQRRGLENIEKRSKRINGQVLFNSVVGKTTFEISIPTYYAKEHTHH